MRYESHGRWRGMHECRLARSREGARAFVQPSSTTLFFKSRKPGVHSNKRTLDRPTSAFRCADLARFCDAGPGAFRPSSLVSGIGRGKKRRFGADILLFRNHKKDLDTVTQWGNIAFFSILPWEIDHRPKPMLHEIFRCSFFHNFGVTQTICLCRYFVKRPGGREYGGGEG